MKERKKVGKDWARVRTLPHFVVRPAPSRLCSSFDSEIDNSALKISGYLTLVDLPQLFTPPQAAELVQEILKWLSSMFHWVNVYQTFLSSCTNSCTALLPTQCHIVIVHIHGGGPGCHIGMISPHLFGFRNLFSVPVNAFAKHRLYRFEADSRYTVTCSKCREQNVLSDVLQRRKGLQQLSTLVVSNLLVCYHLLMTPHHGSYMFWVLSSLTNKSPQVVSFK